MKLTISTSHNYDAIALFHVKLIILVVFDFFLSIFVFLHSIQALLSAPNPDDPLSENIAKHWKTNEAEAVETGMVGRGKHIIPKQKLL